MKTVAMRGFTLIEVLITVAIVSLLASLALPMAELAVKRGKEQELRTALRQIRMAIDAYHQAWEAGKIRRRVDDTGYPPDLDVLVNGVEDQTSADGRRLYFLRRLPRDPFAPAQLPAAATWGRRSYASPPDAPAEGRDVFDVYSLSDGVGLNGIPYREW